MSSDMNLSSVSGFTGCLYHIYKLPGDPEPHSRLAHLYENVFL